MSGQVARVLPVKSLGFPGGSDGKESVQCGETWV